MERSASKNEERLRVFLCHASEDKSLVRQLFAQLVRNPHLDLWLDEKRLVPGRTGNSKSQKQLVRLTSS